MSYLDFELEIGFGNENKYPVAVLHSPAGEARETMDLSSDTLKKQLNILQEALYRSANSRLTPSSQQEFVKEFGKTLFTKMFTGEVGHLYYESLHDAEYQNKGLRIRLRILPPELAAIPWEYLYDVRGRHLSLSLDTPLVRYLELPRSGDKQLAVTPPLRILGMVASPLDQPPLNIEREKKQLQQALKGLQARGLVELKWLKDQSWRGLQRAMRRETWHIFHFIGHGGFDATNNEGFIVLSNEKRKSDLFHASKLARLLSACHDLRLVLLNACEGARGNKQELFSSSAATLVRGGIPAVLAMQYKISDRAAIEFARTFYEALADQLPVDGAVAEARRAISFAEANTIEWGTPVLYMRSLDGKLFRIRGREAKEPTPVININRNRNRNTAHYDEFSAEERSATLLPPPKNEIDELLSQLTGAISRSDLEDVIELAERILKQKPTDQAVQLQLVAAYKKRGLKQHQQGHYEQAIIDYNRAITLQPKTANFYYLRAQSYKGLKKKDATRQDIEQAAKLGHLAAKKQLFAIEPYQSALLAWQENRFEDAMAAFRQVIRLDRTHLGAYHELGVLSYLSGQPDLALDILKHALKVDPKHAESYLNLGLVYNSIGQSDKAIQMLQRYLDFSPPEEQDKKAQAKMLLQTLSSEQ